MYGTVPSSPVCCTLYGYSLHKVQNHAGQKMGELGLHWLQSNKVSDSINYHFKKHHAWVCYSMFRKRWKNDFNHCVDNV